MSDAVKELPPPGVNSKPKAKQYKATFKTVPVEVHEVGGEITYHTLREMSGAKSAFWKDFSLKNTKQSTMNEDIWNIIKFENYHSTLVSLCLFDEQKKEYWSVERVNELRNEILIDLYYEASILNGLALPKAPELDEDDNPKGQLPETTKSGSESQGN